MAADPRAFTAELEGGSVEGRILALEGGRGLMRVALPAPLTPGGSVVLRMHDGTRFRVTVEEALGHGPEAGETQFRLKLAAREHSAPGR